jgi:spore germination protein GerM
VAIAVLFAVLLGACGVGAEDRANRIAPDEVPFGLLEAPPTSAPVASGRSVGLYLVQDDRLHLVERTLESDAGLAELLVALSAGPDEAEQEQGVESLLPPDQIVDVALERGVARVDLAPGFSDLRAEAQTLALAQIVFTLTGQSGIGSVAFTIDGEAAEVPRADGALTTEAVARDDFSTLADAGS